MTLVIRGPQLQALQSVPEAVFEIEVLDYLTRAFPVDWALLGPAQMRRIVRFSVARARACGVSSRGGLCYWAGVAVVLGAYFDEDPQLSWAAVAVSRRGAAESTRLGEIQAGLVAYLDRAGGRRYVRALLRARRMSFAELTDGSPADALARIAQLHPGKAADLGHLDAGSFLALAAAGARLDGLESPRGRALYVVMMVLTSTRFARDPVYPWAREALDAAGADPDARAEALHARAMREIDRVVAQRGGPDA